MICSKDYEDAIQATRFKSEYIRVTQWMAFSKK